MAHRPVLLDEAVTALRLREGGVYVDATFGGGGYSTAMLEAAGVRIVAFDRDPDAVARAERLIASLASFSIVHAPFGNMRAELAARGIAQVDGVVFDLGVSSFQLDQADRGFSFQSDGPLDMRMSRDGPTAADLVGELSEGELARLLAQLGGEPQARSVARAIVRSRLRGPIATTGALAAIVGHAKGGRRSPRDPATRTFQALRMAVNDERGELERGLTAAEAVLRPGGRLVVVSFHSGEDAAVKEFVNRGGGRQAQPSRHRPPVSLSPPRWRWVASGVTKPSGAEIATNPRARSARLRVAERLDEDAGATEDGSWPLAA